MIRVRDLGSLYSVSIGEGEIAAFRDRFPLSGLDDLETLTGEFEKRSGDLVDVVANGGDAERFDGTALTALLADMQCYGEYRLRLEGRCDTEDWKETLGVPTRRLPAKRAPKPAAPTRRARFEILQWLPDDNRFVSSTETDDREQAWLIAARNPRHQIRDRSTQNVQTFIIRKASRAGLTPYSGPAAERAGVEPQRYQYLYDAVQDADRLSAFNPTGFSVVEVSGDVEVPRRINGRTLWRSYREHDA